MKKVEKFLKIALFGFVMHSFVYAGTTNIRVKLPIDPETGTINQTYKMHQYSLMAKSLGMDTGEVYPNSYDGGYPVYKISPGSDNHYGYNLKGRKSQNSLYTRSIKKPQSEFQGSASWDWTIDYETGVDTLTATS